MGQGVPGGQVYPPVADRVIGPLDLVARDQRKRDRFELAKAALTGLLAGQSAHGGSDISRARENPTVAAAWAVEFADAVLAELNKDEPGRS